MIRHDQSSDRDSALAAFRMPPLAFPENRQMSSVLCPIWDVLRSGARATTSVIIDITTTIGRVNQNLRAPLYLALAILHLREGRRDRTVVAAKEAVLAHPLQHAAHRVLIEVFWEQAAYDDAYFYLSTLTVPPTVEAWDELLAPDQRHLALAALAWRVRDWSGVKDHLPRAFGSNINEIPVDLREDLFRVALYRGSAEEAAATASSLLPAYEVDHIDEMLRMLDSRGWSAEALELYRRAFKSNPSNPLLRRRLVGLCIREGHLSEARMLAEGMPLDLAA